MCLPVTFEVSLNCSVCQTCLIYFVRRRAESVTEATRMDVRSKVLITATLLGVLAATTVWLQELPSDSIVVSENNCHFEDFLFKAQEKIEQSKCHIAIVFNDNVTNCTLDMSEIPEFSKIDSFSIIGPPKEDSVVTILCKKGQSTHVNTGLHFDNVRKVTLEQFALVNCQHPIQDDKSGLQGNVAVYITSSEEVYLRKMSIIGTKGIGLVLDSVKKAYMTESTFTDNNYPSPNSHAHGHNDNYTHIGTHTHNTPSSTMYGGAIILQHNSECQGAMYTLTNCTFDNNAASPNHLGPNTSFTNLEGRGGGLSVFVTSSGSVVSIHNCSFTHNRALYGGGLSLHLKHVHNTTVLVSNSNFGHNQGHEHANSDHDHDHEHVESGGGGVQVMIVTTNRTHEQKERDNHVKFVDCSFHDNNAYWGGGASILAGREREGVSQIRFTRCTWFNNKALFGAALDISHIMTQPGQLPTVHIDNSTVANNSDRYFHHEEPRPIGAGAIYTEEVSMEFAGSSYIVDNQCSGIVSADASVHFLTSSDTTILNNHGVKGGGVAIYGNGRIVLHAQSKLDILQNSVLLHGGGIYHQVMGPRNLMVSQQCFIQYESNTVHPTQWDTLVTLSCNSARVEGNDIYATSLRTCIWLGGAYGEGKDTFDGVNANIGKIFNSNLSYIQINHENCSHASYAPSNTSISTTTQNSNITHSTHLYVYPGESSNMLRGYVQNELHVWTGTSVFRGDIKHDDGVRDKVSARLQSTYISGMRIQFEGHTGERFRVMLASPWTQAFTILINVTLTPCPPGLVHLTEEKRCTCSSGTHIKYNGIIRCSRTNGRLHSTLQTTYWAGYLNSSYMLCSDENIRDNETCKMYTGRSSFGFCGKFPQGMLNTTVNLPPWANNTLMGEAICDKQNRTGIICGMCKDGYGYDINSYELTCVPCRGGDTGLQARAWMEWVAIKFLPLTIMVIIFLLFDIDILCGSIQTFIFYCQVLSYLSPVLNQNIELEYATKLVLSITTTLSNLWRLEFKGPLYDYIKPNPPACFRLYGRGDSLILIALDYMTAIFPFVLIITTWSVTRVQERGLCCKPCNAAVRQFRIWIHYLKRNWTPNSTIIHGLSSFIVLSYTKFLIVSILLVMPGYLHSNFSATDPSEEHVVVALDGNISFGSTEHIPFLIVGILILCTVVLIPPVILAFFPLVPRVLARLQPERTNPILKLCDRIFSGPKWQLFPDAFQGSFKPKYSFYAAMFFIYRIGIALSYSLSYRLDRMYIALSLGVLAAAILHAVLQPYRKRLHNVLDSLIFFNMLVIILITSYIWGRAKGGGQSATNWWFWIVLVAMNIPQVVFLGYLTFRIGRIVYRCSIKWKARRRTAHSVRERMHNSEERDNTLLNDSFQNRNSYWESSTYSIPMRETQDLH